MGRGRRCGLNEMTIIFGLVGYILGMLTALMMVAPKRS